MSRQLRTKLPVSSSLLKPKVVYVYDDLCARQLQLKVCYDGSAKPLPLLKRVVRYDIINIANGMIALYVVRLRNLVLIFSVMLMDVYGAIAVIYFECRKYTMLIVLVMIGFVTMFSVPLFLIIIQLMHPI